MSDFADEAPKLEKDSASTVDVSQGFTYDVDIVLCIDATQSMRPVIEAVKSRALQLPDDLHADMLKKGKHVDNLRIRVVAFRDIYFDETPFLVSDFLTMPGQRSDFEAFMRGITALGGGDLPESAMEALAIAMNSEWANASTKKRHLVVVFTDASAHPIESNVGKVPREWESQIPSTMDELTDLWHGSQVSKISPEARRMVLFAPDTTPWTDLDADWDEIIHFPSRAGEGLADFEYNEILDLLAQSI